MMNTNYAAGDTDQYSTCNSNSTTCGNDILIRYPFWVANNETTATNNKYCGYPEFKLTCSKNGQPILTLPTDSYYVTEINYESETLTLVDMDVVNQSCPRARNNVSLTSYPLSYNELDLNLTFYFNCSTNVSYYDHVVLPDSISCFVKSISWKESYVFVKGNETTGYDWSTECDEMVEVVVKQSEINDENSGGLVSEFGKAMGEGFVLDWEKARDCVHCEDSGGYCGGGYVDNRSTDGILCFCKDGSVTSNRCKKKGNINSTLTFQTMTLTF